MAMAHLQRAGHRPIAIIGGGTTMIGDPTDKTEMRPMLSEEQISANSKGMLSQLQRYLDLDNGTASAENPESAPKAGRFLNNADWLLSMNYIEFLRDIGKHFRVTGADKAQTASRAAFGGGNLDDVAMPTSVIAFERLESGIPIMELFHEVGLANSRSHSRQFKKNMYVFRI